MKKLFLLLSLAMPFSAAALTPFGRVARQAVEKARLGAEACRSSRVGQAIGANPGTAKAAGAVVVVAAVAGLAKFAYDRYQARKKAKSKKAA